jgi:hypothetical protein
LYYFALFLNIVLFLPPRDKKMNAPLSPRLFLRSKRLKMIMTRSMYKRYGKIPFWNSSDWAKYAEECLRQADEAWRCKRLYAGWARAERLVANRPSSSVPCTQK